jgi:HEAT repeat protein
MEGPEDALAADLRAPDRARRLGVLERLLAGSGAVPGALVGSLADCLGDRSKAVQRRAADALARVGDPQAVRKAVAPGLDASDPHHRWGAAYALGVAVGPERFLLPVLFEALGHADGDRRWAAAELIVSMGRRESIAGELLGLADGGIPLQRKMALYCIRDLGMRGEGVDAVSLRCLADPDAGVRLAALSVAKRCGRAEALAEAVAGMLEGDPMPGVRRAAASTLGAWRAHPTAARALDRAAESDDVDADVRRVAQQVRRRPGPGRTSPA